MEDAKVSKPVWFVNSVIDRIKQDTAMSAALKRSDNPATEYQGWEYLAAYKVDLEKPWERIPYATIAAAIAREKPEHDGFLSIGEAIAKSGKDHVPSDPERARLRRLLACDTTEEVCSFLRSLLSLIASRDVKVSYGRLLQDLMFFGNKPQVTKARWAQEFFKTSEEA